MRSKKPDFFNVKNTIKSYPDAQYYIFFGERSNGKTYSSLELCLEEYVKMGSMPNFKSWMAIKKMGRRY